MNLKRLVLLFFVSLFLLSGFSSREVSAIPITQSGFSPLATVYDFSSAPIGQKTVTSGILTVQNGIVFSRSFKGGMNKPTYYDGNDLSVIRLDFSQNVSAVGMSVYLNNVNVTLKLYDRSNAFLEQHTLQWKTLPTGPYPYGFIGIDYGKTNIAYALIDTALRGNELYVDNITYQAISPVPEPSTLVFFTLSIFLFIIFEYRKKTTTK